MSSEAEILYTVWRKTLKNRPTRARISPPPHWYELDEDVKAAWEEAARCAGMVPPRLSPNPRVGGYCTSCGAHESEMHLERCPYSPLSTELGRTPYCTCGGSTMTGHTKTCNSRNPVNYQNI